MAIDIIRYLDVNEVFDDRGAKEVRNQVARYTIVDGILYRRGYSIPLLRCISSELAQPNTC